VARGNVVDPAGVWLGGDGAMSKLGWFVFQVLVMSGFVWLVAAVAAEDGSNITRPGLMIFFAVFFAWFLTIYVSIYVELFASLKRRFFGKKGASESPGPSVGSGSSASHLLKPPNAIGSRREHSI
jgi:hypothetical protein